MARPYRASAPWRAPQTASAALSRPHRLAISPDPKGREPSARGASHGRSSASGGSGIGARATKGVEGAHDASVEARIRAPNAAGARRDERFFKIMKPLLQLISLSFESNSSLLGAATDGFKSHVLLRQRHGRLRRGKCAAIGLTLSKRRSKGSAQPNAAAYQKCAKGDERDNQMPARHCITQ